MSDFSTHDILSEGNIKKTSNSKKNSFIGSRHESRKKEIELNGERHTKFYRIYQRIAKVARGWCDQKASTWRRRLHEHKPRGRRFEQVAPIGQALVLLRVSSSVQFDPRLKVARGWCDQKASTWRRRLHEHKPRGRRFEQVAPIGQALVLLRVSSSVQFDPRLVRYVAAPSQWPPLSP